MLWRVDTVKKKQIIDKFSLFSDFQSYMLEIFWLVVGGLAMILAKPYLHRLGNSSGQKITFLLSRWHEEQIY